MNAFTCARGLIVAAGLLFCGDIPVTVAFAETPAVTDKSAAGELAYWNQVKDSTNPDDVKNYLAQFPDGMFADPAAKRYEELTGQKLDLSTLQNPDAGTDGSSQAGSADSQQPPAVVPATTDGGSKQQQTASSKIASTKLTSAPKRHKARTGSASAGTAKTGAKKLATHTVQRHKRTNVASSGKSITRSLVCAGSSNPKCTSAYLQSHKISGGGNNGTASGGSGGTSGGNTSAGNTGGGNTGGGNTGGGGHTGGGGNW